MNMINPYVEEYTTQLCGGIIEIGGEEYSYESMTITSKLWEKGYEKTQDITIELCNVSLVEDIDMGIETETELLFTIIDKLYKYPARLEEYSIMHNYSDSIPNALYIGRYNSMKFSIGLAGRHINKGLHKLVISISQGLGRGDE